MRIEPFSDAELTRDAFLGGRVHILQPKTGYRAGVDPVLLAASVQARAGDAVLDLGCGAGAALACLQARIAGLALTGVEVQPGYAQLAARNLPGAEIFCEDLTALSAGLKAKSFDHVIANPPYFDSRSGRCAEDAGRQTGRAMAGALEAWVATAAKRLRPGGYATFVSRMENLPNLLAAFDARLGSVVCLPLAPRRDRAPRLMLLRGRKEGRAAFEMRAPLILHRGAAHEVDAESYTQTISAVLRDGAALTI